MKDIDLHEWQRYSTVFSLLFRNQFGNKIKACDLQLVHYLGVDPESKHRGRADTDLTLLIGAVRKSKGVINSSFSLGVVPEYKPR